MRVKIKDKIIEVPKQIQEQVRENKKYNYNFCYGFICGRCPFGDSACSRCTTIEILEDK